MERIGIKVGFVLDNDGTLVDTHELILQSFEYSAANIGVRLSRDQINDVLGLSLQSCYQTLIPGEDIVRLCKMHEDFQMQNQYLINVFPEVLETLDELRRRGHPLAIVTNWYGGIPSSLRVTGIDQIIKTVVTCDDVIYPKPHPEMVLTALSRMGVDSRRAILVGDSLADIQAGMSSKVKKVIGVDYTLQKRDLLLDAGADLVIRNFSELLNFT